MPPVSTIALSVNLNDAAFVDPILSRWLYRGSAYAIDLTVFQGAAKVGEGNAVALKILSSQGEHISINGTDTDADGKSLIEIAQGAINFDGDYTAVICINGSKSAEFPLEIRAVGSPVPPTGTVLDWNSITSYAGTATHGPYRAGTNVIFSAPNPDGSVNINASGGGGGATLHSELTLDDGTNPHGTTAADVGALPAGDAAVDANPAGTLLAGALAGKISKTGADQTIENAGGITVLRLKGTGSYTQNRRTSADLEAQHNFVDETTSPVSGWNTGYLRTSNTPEEGAFTVVRNFAGATTLALWCSRATRLWHFVTGIVSPLLRALTTDGLALQDSTGTEHALLTSTGLRIRPRIVSSSITAELDGVYHGVATATYTDPATPAEGRGYIVRVVNGTQTVGGTGYSVAGTVLHRFWHSGAWQTVRKFVPGDFQPLDSDLTAYADAADAAARRALITPIATTPTASADTLVLDFASANFQEYRTQDGDTHPTLTISASNIAANRVKELVVTNTGAANVTLVLDSDFAKVGAIPSTIATDGWVALRFEARGSAANTVSVVSLGAPDVSGFALKTPAVNAQTGTSYTLAATDAGAIVTMTNAAANLLTIPTNTSVSLPVGTIINVIQGGAGVTSIKGATGVTLNGVSAGEGAMTAQYQGVALTKVATDTWYASGAIGGVA
jgi:hypothetical protein